MKTTYAYILLLSSVICLSCNNLIKPTEKEKELIGQIEKMIDIRQQLAEKYWPEFNEEELTVPIVFFTDSVCYVLNPKEGFLNQLECEKIETDNLNLYRTSLLDTIPFHMETHTDIFTDTTCYGKTPYLMCSNLEEAQKAIESVKDERDWIPMVIHEMVHGCQDSHPCHYIARQSIEYEVFEWDLAAYPSNHQWLCDSLVAENNCLLAAINAENEDERTKNIAQFLQCRKNRKAKMREVFGDIIVKQEEEFETMESMARFMEVQSALLVGNPDSNYAEDSFYFCENIQKDYFFITGYNLVRLFLKIGIDLDLPYQTTEHKALESYL